MIIELRDIVQAQRAISREIEVGRLIETLLTVAMNLVSAERGLLFLDRGREFDLEAEGTTSDGIVRVALPVAFVSSPRFPQSVLRYVVRLEETVVLDHALAGNQFSGDDYMAREGLHSLLCLPLTVQRNLVGALYLENAVAPHAFARERLTALELLACQAALSLKAAALGAELLHEIKKRRTAEAELERFHRTKG
jgi:GAF domain-containing protein